METSRTDNVGEDKLSDTDERAPFVKPKDKAARRNFQSSWLEIHVHVQCTTHKLSIHVTHLHVCWLDCFFIFHKQKPVCPPQKTGMSPRKLLTGTECPPKVKSFFCFFNCKHTELLTVHLIYLQNGTILTLLTNTKNK